MTVEISCGNQLVYKTSKADQELVFGAWGAGSTHMSMFPSWSRREEQDQVITSCRKKGKISAGVTSAGSKAASVQDGRLCLTKPLGMEGGLQE